MTIHRLHSNRARAGTLLTAAALAIVIAAIPSSRAAAQTAPAARTAPPARGIRVEIGLGAAHTAPSEPMPKLAGAVGPAFALAVHGHYAPRVLFGIDAAGWTASRGGERSHAEFVLASTRLLFPSPAGLGLMLGAGWGGAQFADFQHDPRFPGRIDRVALGGGLDYRLSSSGSFGTSVFARFFNTLGGPTNAPGKQNQEAQLDPTRYHGGAVMSQVGVSVVLP